MFEIGNSIVYPSHGAGVIEKIEEQDIAGDKSMFYTINLVFGNMRILLSIKNADEQGVRLVSSQEEFDKALTELEDISTEMPKNWNKRFRENGEKIKTGNLIDVLEVYRNLEKLDTDKGLSNAEKKQLNNAKEIILSEVMLMHDIDEEDAEVRLRKSLNLT